MKFKNDFEGIIAALVTPVTDGEIQTKQLKKSIRFVMDNGSDGTLVLGGTGEYVSLSKKQRLKAIETTVEEVNGKGPVMAGILAPGLHDAIEMGREAEKIGADAVMLLTPYYQIATQEGLLNYYLSFIEEVHLPILIYNIPYRTNVNLEPETVAQLIEKTSQIVGFKQSWGDIKQMTKYIDLIGDKVSWLCGEEYLLFSALLLGAKGGVLASANLFPNAWKKMYLSIKEGNIKKAREIHSKMLPLNELIFSETNPGPLKEAMKYMGLDCGASLTPLIKPRPDLMTKIENIIDELQVWKDTL